MNEVVIISGATCTGKTALAIDIAEKNNAEIISCDSVQIYKKADIGSAKASVEEQQRIRHHLIDVVNVDEIFDVATYVELAKKALQDITNRGKNVVVVGGSGFYLKSWFMAVADTIQIPKHISDFASKIEEEGGAKALAIELLKIDKLAAETIDICNPRRTKNALERCLATSKSVRQLRSEFEKLPCPMGEFPRKFVLLDVEDDKLFQRITLRTNSMIENGLIEETKKLIDLGILKNPSLKNSTGYKQAIEFIQNNSTDLQRLKDDIAIQTMSLVRKQRKYFASQLKDIPRSALSSFL